jgi:hypothetical protein
MYRPQLALPGASATSVVCVSAAPTVQGQDRATGHLSLLLPRPFLPWIGREIHQRLGQGCKSGHLSSVLFTLIERLLYTKPEPGSSQPLVLRCGHRAFVYVDRFRPSVVIKHQLCAGHRSSHRGQR